MPEFVSWYFATTILGFVGFLWSWRLFSWLPDRGVILSRLVGLLLVGYFHWLSVSLKLTRNDLSGIVIVIIALGVSGFFAMKKVGHAPSPGWIRSNLMTLGSAELLFLLAFAGWSWVRAHNASILGTEKPMEFMFINSIARSSTFPPVDAWLSGHAISYYYFGYVLSALLSVLTSTDTAIGFNLSVGLFFSLAMVASYGVAVNLMALLPGSEKATRGHPASPDDDVEVVSSPSLRARVALPALLAPLFVVFAGNYYGVLALARDNGLLQDLKIPTVYYDYGEVTEQAGVAPVIARMPGLSVGSVPFWDWIDTQGLPADAPPVSSSRSNDWNWDPGFWWWFQGARITNDRDLVGHPNTINVITEFPAFSFILGDLHPHVMSLPFTMLVMAAALNWMLRASRDPVAEWLMTEPGTWAAWRRWGTHVATGMLLGAIAFLNTWDFPTYFALVALAMISGLAFRLGWRNLFVYWFPVGRVVAVWFVVSFVAYSPFYLTLQTQAQGVLPNLEYPTRAQHLVITFGHVLLSSSLWLGWRMWMWRRLLDASRLLKIGALLLCVIVCFAFSAYAIVRYGLGLDWLLAGSVAPLSIEQASRLLLIRRMVDSVSTLAPILAISFILTLVAKWLAVPVGDAAQQGAPIRAAAHGSAERLAGRVDATLQVPDKNLVELFLFLLIGLGAGLVLIPEWLFVRDSFGARMNTVFKFYYAAWTLWGIAGSVGAWWLWQSLSRRARPLIVGVIALSVFAGMAYTLPALASSISSPQSTGDLDGMAYFASSYPDDWEAIEWLRENASPDSTLAEGIGGQYWIEGRFSRISMATGIPTVMGWPGHESQWRGRYFAAVSAREGDIRRLYATRDEQEARAIMDQYHIEYVIVSPLELSQYGIGLSSPQIRKFSRICQLVFSSGDVEVFRRTVSP